MGNHAWPPTLADVKTDQGITTTVDDVRLGQALDATVAYVQRVRGEDFNFALDPLSTLPAPDDDLWLGCARYIGRLHARRRSVDGIINAGDQGISRIPSFDPDIERLLGIGIFRDPVFG